MKRCAPLDGVSVGTGNSLTLPHPSLLEEPLFPCPSLWCCCGAWRPLAPEEEGWAHSWEQESLSSWRRVWRAGGSHWSPRSPSQDPRPCLEKASLLALALYHADLQEASGLSPTLLPLWAHFRHGPQPSTHPKG